MKELVSRRLGASSTRAYRLAYNAFSVLSLAPVALLMRATPDRWLYRVEMPWTAILVGGQAVAVILMLAALLQTDTLHFAGLSQLIGPTTSATLVTTGFYGMVRHPLYLFGLLIMWLTPFMSLNQLTVYAVLRSVHQGMLASSDLRVRRRQSLRTRQ
jgi:protein-S-isoprenylcysteine O-methyltransferase Ste14